MPAAARPATTILLLRETGSGAGFEVFMVQRHRRSGFLPNAWVFPGGRVDESDRLHDHPAVRGGEGVLDRMGLTRADGVPFLVAGVRETFEEAGIWLGDGALPESAREPLARREITLPSLLAEHDAVLDLDRLVSWSWWVTPEAEPKRYDTRFLVALIDGEVGRHDETETVASGWYRPHEIVADATLQTFPLAPPTWWTLRELAAHDTAQAVLDAASAREQRPIQPVMRFGDDGIVLLLPGHPEHPQPPMRDMATRVVFEDGRWVAWDGETRLPAVP